SLTDMGFTVADNSTYEIQIRGVTDGGISNPSTIEIRYGLPKQIVLTSGSALSTNTNPRLVTSTNFKGAIKVAHAVNNNAGGFQSTADQMTLKTSTNYQMRTGLMIGSGLYTPAS